MRQRNVLLLRWLASPVVFLLFAYCGKESAVVFFDHFPESSFLFPMPFALLCTVLFLRNPQRAAIAGALIMAVWQTSYVLADLVGMGLPMGQEKEIAPILVGGFVGGAGLVLSVAVCHRPLVSVRYIAIGALIGVAAALSFVHPLIEFEMNVNSGFIPTPTRSFALWDAAMGTYLYAISLYVRTQPSADESAEEESTSLRVTPS